LDDNVFIEALVTRQLRIVAQVFIVALGVFLYSTSNAQVTFTQILNNKVVDPIGGNFSPDASSPPAIDGSSVVFRNIGSGGPELWSSNLNGSTLTNLATTQSVLPGLINAGNLSGLSQAPAIVRDDTVLFSASDHMPDQPSRRLRWHLEYPSRQQRLLFDRKRRRSGFERSA
jgi:hypothetical protein